MIKVEKISVRQFRGLKELDLDFKSKSFGVCGPNGTGKSGVVDAIEFALTGGITRLTREGTSDIKLSDHGPHVDAQKTPETAIVSITGTLLATGKPVTVTRSVKKPKSPSIKPNDAATKEAISQIERHPEFALSRREIAKYIVTPPGQRSADVVNLLRLGELEKIRKALQTVANSEQRAANAAKVEHGRAKSEFIFSLQIETATKEAVLNAVNRRRAVLGLKLLDELTAETQITEGLSVAKAGEEGDKKTGKKAAILLTQSILTRGKSETDDSRSSRASLIADLSVLQEDVVAFKSIRQSSLVEQGLALIESDLCPLCDVEWNEGELREYLDQKLRGATATRVALNELNRRIEAFRSQNVDWRDSLSRAKRLGQDLKIEGDASAIEDAINRANDIETVLSQDISKSSVILANTLKALNADWCVLDALTTAWLDKLKLAIEQLPDQSKETEARDFLLTGQVNYEKSVERLEEAKKTASSSSKAERVLEHFNISSTEALNEIYETVSSDFVSYYRQINSDDESKFTGGLTLKPAKLSLDVDFYGRGEFPPGAFHSEGHQDGMGLCLYLALMKHTLGDSFRFCVLDDVLMSVDASHRRDVCRLLRKEFPDTQFVVTTHDRVWLRYMRTEKLIAGATMFDGWTVDTGPRIWEDLNVWSEIENALEQSDVPKASFILRRYLEHVGFALCDGLRAQVRFRGDGRYDFGDLIPSAFSRVAKQMKKARAAAKSWGKTDTEEQIDLAIEKFSTAVATTEAERWAMNPTVHYNEWANLGAPEFKVVVDAFSVALTALQCDTCQGFIHIAYGDGKEEAMRCPCGNLSFELIAKSAA